MRQQQRQEIKYPVSQMIISAVEKCEQGGGLGNVAVLSYEKVTFEQASEGGEGASRAEPLGGSGILHFVLF